MIFTKNESTNDDQNQNFENVKINEKNNDENLMDLENNYENEEMDQSNGSNEEKMNENRIRSENDIESVIQIENENIDEDDKKDSEDSEIEEEEPNYHLKYEKNEGWYKQSIFFNKDKNCAKTEVWSNEEILDSSKVDSIIACLMYTGIPNIGKTSFFEMIKEECQKQNINWKIIYNFDFVIKNKKKYIQEWGEKNKTVKIDESDDHYYNLGNNLAKKQTEKALIKFARDAEVGKWNIIILDKIFSYSKSYKRKSKNHRVKRMKSLLKRDGFITTVHAIYPAYGQPIILNSIRLPYSPILLIKSLMNSFFKKRNGDVKISEDNLHDCKEEEEDGTESEEVISYPPAKTTLLSIAYASIANKVVHEEHLHIISLDQVFPVPFHNPDPKLIKLIPKELTRLINECLKKLCKRSWVFQDSSIWEDLASYLNRKRNLDILKILKVYQENDDEKLLKMKEKWAKEIIGKILSFQPASITVSVKEIEE